MTLVQAEENLKLLINEANDLLEKSVAEAAPHWNGYDRWRVACEIAIEQIFGLNHRYIYDFRNIRFIPPQSPGVVPSAWTNLVYYTSGLQIVKEMLEGVLISLRIWWPGDSTQNKSPAVFIAHGGRGSNRYLPKVKKFLTSLGLYPVVVEDMPNIGVSLQTKVQLYAEVCNAAIILLTAEDITTKGEARVRPNVDHEVGMLQLSQQIGNRIIYLKETRVILPTNYRERSWHELSNNNIEEIFIKIIEELKAFGMI